MMFDYRNHIFYSPASEHGDEPVPVDPSEEETGSETEPGETEPTEPTPPAVEELKPKTRREKFLAKIAGEEISIAPKTRREKFLAKIANAESGDDESESGSGGGVFKVTFIFGDNDKFLADKTVSEIIEAYEAGKLIYAEFSYEEGATAVGVLESLTYTAACILCEFKFGNYDKGTYRSFKFRKLLTPDDSSGGDDDPGDTGK